MTFDADKFVALDLETHLIEPGILAPKIVCGSTADASGARLLPTRADALAFAKALLASSAIIVGANVAFDFGCLAVADPSLIGPIFDAYAAERVYDVQVAQALHAIAEGNLYQDPETLEPLKGRYSLERCVKFVLGRDDAKARDDWRLRYALLDGVPVDEWPDEARQYPVDDAANTLEVARAQVLGPPGHHEWETVGTEEICEHCSERLTFGRATPRCPAARHLPHRNLADLPQQVEAAWALHLGAMWGLRTDSDRIEVLRAETEAAHAKFVERFRALGFFKKDGKRDLPAIKRAVIRAYGGGDKCGACVGGKVLSEKSGNPVNCSACSGTGLDPGGAPRTPAGGVSADRDSLVESGDADLAALGDNEPEKVRETYLPFLEQGVARPISLRPNVLVASGRTSYDGLIQLMPRDGGARGCFRARPGYVFCSVDYSAGELCTLSQVCLWVVGHSQMAETINATGEPGALHTALAARFAGKTTEEMVALVRAKDENAKRYRQAAKPVNFGFPGGMGAAKLVLAQRKKSAGVTVAPDGTKIPGIRFCVLLLGAERCGVEKVTRWRDRETPPICKACVELVDSQLRPAWFEQWPEVRPYFAWVSERVGEYGRGELPCFGTDRVRGGLDFTNGANNGFQALLADGAKHALRKVTREAYTDRRSPLWGTRPIFFAHDEVFAEVPESVAHVAGPRMAEVMVGALREYVPDVHVVAEPALMRHWNKNAEPAYRDFAGERRLICWEDRDAA